MTATIKDGNLIITIPMQAPRPSSSGKTMLVASETALTAAQEWGRLVSPHRCMRDDAYTYLREPAGITGETREWFEQKDAEAARIAAGEPIR